MNIYTKTLIAALGAVTFAALPTAAHADRAYFLVGMRHIYRIGASRHAGMQERQRIEQDYADQVAADQEQFNKAVAEGADPKEESPRLNAALDDLADQRDKELSTIYPNADWVRQRQPELVVESDGPYQVVGVNFHMEGGYSKFDSYTIYKPWPDYPIDENPYGWRYNIAYTPSGLRAKYLEWSGRFAPEERPVFVGLYGASAPVVYEIRVAHEYRFVREYHRHHVDFERTNYYRGRGSLRERRHSLPPRRVIGGPGGAVRPGGPGGVIRPGGPGGVVRPGGPGGVIRPGGPGSEVRPGGPGGVVRPGGPGGVIRPGGPGGVTRPGGPTGGHLPSAGSRPPRGSVPPHVDPPKKKKG